jgi:DNA-binding NtrC family response regulator
MSDATLVIVEPDILVRHPLAEYLRECGYEVLEALNIEEARQLIGAHAQSIGVVLADASGAGVGSAFAAWVQSEHPGIEVILAGSPERATVQAGELCEDGPAVAKPYDHAYVLERIRRLLATRARDQGGE